jgi:hypothetical protein
LKYSSGPNSTLLDPKILPTQDTPKPNSLATKNNTPRNPETLSQQQTRPPLSSMQLNCGEETRPST